MSPSPCTAKVAASTIWNPCCRAVPTARDPAGVIVKLLLQFLSQATFPGEVHVGSRIERVGRTSITLGQGLFKDDVCFATAESVLVWVDLDAGRPAALPADLVAKLGAEAPAAAQPL